MSWYFFSPGKACGFNQAAKEEKNRLFIALDHQIFNLIVTCLPLVGSESNQSSLDFNQSLMLHPGR